MCNFSSLVEVIKYYSQYAEEVTEAEMACNFLKPMKIGRLGRIRASIDSLSQDHILFVANIQPACFGNIGCLEFINSLSQLKPSRDNNFTWRLWNKLRSCKLAMLIYIIYSAFQKSHQKACLNYTMNQGLKPKQAQAWGEERIRAVQSQDLPFGTLKWDNSQWFVCADV